MYIDAVKKSDLETRILTSFLPADRIFLRLLSKFNRMGENVARGDFKYKDKETLSAYGKKGAERSAEVRRAKKNMREMLDVVLSLPLKRGSVTDVEEIRNFAALKGKNLTVEQAMLIAQIGRALKGDTKAAQLILRLSGKDVEDWS